MEDKNRTYRRKKKWIIPSFQARYTALLVAVTGAVLIFLGLLYSHALSEQRRMMGLELKACEEVRGAALQDEEFDRDLREATWQSEDRPTLLILFCASVVFVLLLAYVGVRMTFRAAGPVYAVSRMIRAMAMGNLSALRPLRRGDEFRFLYEDLAALRDSLRREAASDCVLLRRTVETIRSLPPPSQASDKAVLEELVEELEGAIRAKRERLGGLEEGLE